MPDGPSQQRVKIYFPLKPDSTNDLSIIIFSYQLYRAKHFFNNNCANKYLKKHPELYSLNELLMMSEAQIRILWTGSCRHNSNHPTLHQVLTLQWYHDNQYKQFKSLMNFSWS